MCERRLLVGGWELAQGRGGRAWIRTGSVVELGAPLKLQLLVYCWRAGESHSVGGAGKVFPASFSLSATLRTPLTKLDLLGRAQGLLPPVHDKQVVHSHNVDVVHALGGKLVDVGNETRNLRVAGGREAGVSGGEGGEPVVSPARRQRVRQEGSAPDREVETRGRRQPPRRKEAKWVRVKHTILTRREQSR